MWRERFLTIALALVGLSVFISPATRELFVGDETKYAQVVREMRAGAFFLPTLEGTPFTHKPPLHFWMVDALTYVFGVYSTWSFVLPSLVAFLALLLLMWRMEGPVAAFVCGTSLLMWGSAQTARMDVPFTLTIAIAIWMLERDELLAAAGLFGIATLIKGPMAPVIALFLLLFEWLRRRRVPRGHRALAALTMIAVPMLWFVPAMVIGGGGFAREVLVKQTAGRAVGAWVHRSPPWFYILHAPGTLFPWFLLLLVAIAAAYRRNDERAQFYVSWVLAVLVPYSLLSSKLDVYMMAMIPAMALLAGRLVAVDDEWAWRGAIANRVTIVLTLIAGGSAPFIAVRRDDLATVLASIRPAFFILVSALAVALVLTIVSSRAVVSTMCLGLAPLAMMMFLVVFRMSFVNELASDRPIVRALVAQHVPAAGIALYNAPHLWTRDMAPELEHVRYVSPEELRSDPPTLIVTSRAHANEIADVLRTYRRVGEFRMIGKPFDVYRR